MYKAYGLNEMTKWINYIKGIIDAVEGDGIDFCSVDAYSKKIQVYQGIEAIASALDVAVVFESWSEESIKETHILGKNVFWYDGINFFQLVKSEEEQS